MIVALSHERRARIWLNQAPPAPVRMTAPTSRHERVTGVCLNPTHTVVALELLIHLGGRYMYGLLGSELLGEESQTPDILVPTTDRLEHPFADSLAAKVDTVWWGLPTEYAAAVLRGAESGARKFGAPAASTIRFSFAAHGQVGSAKNIFERLARAIMALHVVPTADLVDIRTTIERLIDVPGQ